MKISPLFSKALVAAVFLFSAIEQPVHAADKFELQDQQSIAQVLSQFVGKPVKIVLKSGHELSGTVTKVAGNQPNSLLHLSSLTGAEFYDAVVRVDDIAAVVIRTK